MAVASARGSARPQTSSSPTIAPAGVPTAYTVWLVSTGVPNRRYTSAAYSQTAPDTITPKYLPPISADICGSCSPAARRAGSGLYDPFSLCLKIYFYKTHFLFPLEIILFSLFYNFSRQKPLFFFAIFVYFLSPTDMTFSRRPCYNQIIAAERRKTIYEFNLAWKIQELF